MNMTRHSQTAKYAEEINFMVREMVFGEDSHDMYERISDLALNNDIYPASIQSLYEAIGRGYFHGFTVPAINLRGLTYDVARAAFRAATKENVGAFIFEIARSELEYTNQSPREVAGCVLAAALAEDYQGPVFLQGDHIQIRRNKYITDAHKELDDIKTLIAELVKAGFYNIDIDASTLVNIEKPDLLEQQELNSRITVDLTKFIRSIQPKSIVISIGGEIGEIGKGNSTMGDLKAFMEQYIRLLSPSLVGISKISVQTGTKHGGVVLQDGSIGSLELDLKTLKELSKMAREDYHLGGAVQHGASTLPNEMFDIFPKKGTLEVHLATGFQNIIFDSPDFPRELLNKIYASLLAKYATGRKKDENDIQFYYRNRKRAFGDFKKEIWDMPQSNRNKILRELEGRFSIIYQRLNVLGTGTYIKKLIKQ
jgi:fructose/tagatose bisphosphate aldolase